MTPESPAFPDGNRPGLTQRDYTAIMAMQPLLGVMSGFDPCEGSETKDMAEMAYRIADAMIAASMTPPKSK